MDRWFPGPARLPLIHMRMLNPNSTNRLYRSVFMEYRHGDSYILRTFNNSWELFGVLEGISHQGGSILALCENREDGRFQLTETSLRSLNLYLAAFGDLRQWKRAHVKGTWSRWGWSDFCRHLDFQWSRSYSSCFSR